MTVDSPPLLFIGGFPRFGTSLLSALVGNIPGVNVVQDLCLFYYLKQAILQCMLEANGQELRKAMPLAINLHARFDLRGTEFIHEFMDSSPVEVLNSPHLLNGRILRRHIFLMDIFLFTDLNLPDPRKDRGQGAVYLKNLNIGRILECGSMREAYIEILRASSDALVSSDDSCVELVCDKTPENLITTDLIELCSQDLGYRFLHLTRDPVAVFGSRRQRKDVPAGPFADLFAERAVSRFEKKRCISSSVVRYEDLLVDPSAELIRVFNEMGMHKIASKVDFSSGINPGKYTNYVGTAVDPSRNSCNVSLVSDAEKTLIYEKLSSYCEEFGYGPYAPA